MAKLEEMASAEEAGLGRFNSALEEVETQKTSDMLNQAAEQVRQAENERAEMKSKADEEMNERHGLQVSVRAHASLIYSPLTKPYI